MPANDCVRRVSAEAATSAPPMLNSASASNRRPIEAELTFATANIGCHIFSRRSARAREKLSRRAAFLSSLFSAGGRREQFRPARESGSPRHLSGAARHVAAVDCFAGCPILRALSFAGELSLSLFGPRGCSEERADGRCRLKGRQVSGQPDRCAARKKSLRPQTGGLRQSAALEELLTRARLSAAPRGHFIWLGSCLCSRVAARRAGDAQRRQRRRRRLDSLDRLGPINRSARGGDQIASLGVAARGLIGGPRTMMMSKRAARAALIPGGAWLGAMLALVGRQQRRARRE